MNTALDRIYFEGEDGGGAGEQTTQGFAQPIVAAPMQAIEQGAPAGLDPNLLLQQLVASQQSQSEAMQMLAGKFSALASQPGMAEMDTRSPEEKKIDELSKTVEALASRTQAERHNAVVNAVLADANSVVDTLIQQDPLASTNPALANYIKNSVLGGVKGIVTQQGDKHNLTTTGVAHLYRQVAEQQKQILQSHPGYNASVAEAQAAVNKRAVDAPGSASPAPGAGGLPLDPDTQEYWDAKKDIHNAAWSRLSNRGS